MGFPLLARVPEVYSRECEEYTSFIKNVRFNRGFNGVLDTFLTGISRYFLVIPAINLSKPR